MKGGVVQKFCQNGINETIQRILQLPISFLNEWTLQKPPTPSFGIHTFCSFHKINYDNFESLPTDMLHEIYSRIVAHDDVNATAEIITISQINKRLREIARDIASHENFKADLHRTNLTDQDFHNYFGKGGIFENVKRLNLIGAEFDPKLVANLPKSLVELSIDSAYLRGREFNALAENLKSLQSLTIDNKGLRSP